MQPDADFDQVRRPQGSLVVELFNPNPPLTIGNQIGGQKPSELYTQANPDNVSMHLYSASIWPRQA